MKVRRSLAVEAAGEAVWLHAEAAMAMHWHGLSAASRRNPKCALQDKAPSRIRFRSTNDELRVLSQHTCVDAWSIDSYRWYIVMRLPAVPQFTKDMDTRSSKLKGGNQSALEL
ncbi:hypothetical protein MRB53_040698 [Persea americana]|nr:hypothetical protein MRB53_040698 [Persea americana]